MTGHRKLTQAELFAELTERFGPDPMGWAFKCPACGDVATGGDFKAALAEHPRTHRGGEPVWATDIFGQECVGRTLGALDKDGPKYTGRGCNFAAYGFIPGPWAVELPDGGQMHVFPIGPAPAEASRG